MRSHSLAFLAALFPFAAPAWTPPAQPDPQAILAEAREDRIARRFDDALAKHLWFHGEALQVDPAFGGVRLSFALSHWANLASKYEPAMVALRRARDAAEADVREGLSPRQAFAEFAAINRELDEDQRTRELFLWIDGNDVLLARFTYPIAQTALVEAKDFALCGKYIEPAAELARLAQVQRSIDATMKRRFVQMEEKEAFDRFFINGASTLVAILAVNGRRTEAAEMTNATRRILDTPEMRTALEQALEGRVPGRFPSRAEAKALRESMP